MVAVIGMMLVFLAYYLVSCRIGQLISCGLLVAVLSLVVAYFVFIECCAASVLLMCYELWVLLLCLFVVLVVCCLDVGFGELLRVKLVDTSDVATYFDCLWVNMVTVVMIWDLIAFVYKVVLDRYAMFSFDLRFSWLWVLNIKVVVVVCCVMVLEWMLDLQVWCSSRTDNVSSFTYMSAWILVITFNVNFIMLIFLTIWAGVNTVDTSPFVGIFYVCIIVPLVLVLVVMRFLINSLLMLDWCGRELVCTVIVMLSFVGYLLACSVVELYAFFYSLSLHLVLVTNLAVLLIALLVIGKYLRTELLCRRKTGLTQCCVSYNVTFIVSLCCNSFERVGVLVITSGFSVAVVVCSVVHDCLVYNLRDGILLVLHFIYLVACNACIDKWICGLVGDILLDLVMIDLLSDYFVSERCWTAYLFVSDYVGFALNACVWVTGYASIGVWVEAVGCGFGVYLLCHCAGFGNLVHFLGCLDRLVLIVAFVHWIFWVSWCGKFGWHHAVPILVGILLATVVLTFDVMFGFRFGELGRQVSGWCRLLGGYYFGRVCVARFALFAYELSFDSLALSSDCVVYLLCGNIVLGLYLEVLVFGCGLLVGGLDDWFAQIVGCCRCCGTAGCGGAFAWSCLSNAFDLISCRRLVQVCEFLCGDGTLVLVASYFRLWCFYLKVCDLFATFGRVFVGALGISVDLTALWWGSVWQVDAFVDMVELDLREFSGSGMLLCCIYVGSFLHFAWSKCMGGCWLAGVPYGFHWDVRVRQILAYLIVEYGVVVARI
eukprot:gene2836-1821_t